MPKEINLLPDDLRKEEGRARAATPKNTRGEFHIPGAPQIKVALEEAKRARGWSLGKFFSRFFRRNPKKKVPPLSSPPFKGGERVEKVPPLASPPFKGGERVEKASPKPTASPQKISKPLPSHAPQEVSASALSFHLPEGGMRKMWGTDFLSLHHFEAISDPVRLARRRWEALFLLTLSYLIIFFGSWGIVYSRERHAAGALKSSEAELARLSGEISNSQKQWDESFGRAVSVAEARDLLSERIDWRNALGFLKERTISGIRYREFQSLPAGGFSLELVAPSYEAFVRELLVLDQFPETVERYSFGDIRALEGEGIAPGTIGVTLQIYFSKSFLEAKK